MDFYAALGQHRFEDAYGMLSPDLRETLALEDFASRYENLVDVGIQKSEVQKEGNGEIEIVLKIVLTRTVDGKLIDEVQKVVWNLKSVPDGWTLDGVQEETLQTEERPLKSPEEAVVAYYRALQDRRYGVAYGLRTSAFRRDYPYDQFVADYKMTVETQLEEMKRRELSATEATVYCRVRTMDVEDLDMVTRLWGVFWTLRLEGGRWRLHEENGRVMTKSVQPVAWLEVPIVNFYAAINDGNHQTAYDLLTRGRQATLSFEDFVAEYANVQGVRVVKLHKLEVGPLEARVVVGIDVDEVQDDGSVVTTSYDVEWLMRRVGDSWRLDEAHTEAKDR